MAERNTFQSWWQAVPLEEKPALKVLVGLVLIAATLGGVAALSQFVL